MGNLAGQPQVERLIAGRRLLVRQVELVTLRLGRQTIRRVNAYVLPPEAEDLGSRLGRAAFGLARPRLNDADWVLELLPADGAKR